MSENTVRKFQNEEVINAIKKTLSVETINNSLINTPEKLILYADYWKRKSVGATKELAELCNLEIARAEATMLRMMDLTQDILEVQASAYIDTVGFTPDTSIKEVIKDDKKDAKVVSIFSGDEIVETPKLSDLSIAVKQLLRKNSFDSAMLLATQYLSVGNYIPKKDKQAPIKWEEAKIASWIKDINNNLLEEKRDVSKETTVIIEPVKGNEDVAAKGLTLDEVANLKSLKIISPKSIPGTNADYKALRNVLATWLTIGNTLNIEDEMLWTIGSKIHTLVTSNDDTKTKELIDNLASIDDFCTAFFKHRGYTKESIITWRDAIRKDKGVSNFKYLKVNKDIDPLKLPKSGISYEAIEKRIEEEVIAGKTEIDILKDLEEGILYKEIIGKDSSTLMYTKLHTKDLVNRMYSKYATRAVVAEPLSIGKNKIAIEEIKLLISTIIGNAGILDDVKIHPEILALLNKEIITTEKSPALKFGNETTLFPWIETIFNEINAKLGKVKAVDIEKAVDERKDLPTFSLDSMLTLVERACKEGITQQKFIEEQKDLVLSKDGKWKNLIKSDNKGNKTTIMLTSQKDFEKWISEVYTIQEKLNTSVNTDSKVDSFKELTEQGKKLLTIGTTYEKFIEWLNKNLLNRKMKEQKDGKEFKSPDAIANFAKNIFGELLPKSEKGTVEVVDITTRTDLEAEEIDAYIAELSKGNNATFIQLTRLLHDMYVKNDILIEEEICTPKLAIEAIDEIIEISNPTMFAERKNRIEARKQKNKDIPELKFIDKPVQGFVEAPKTEETEHHVFEKIHIETVDPGLWKLIKDFKTLNEVHNMALEYMEADKFDYALSMCLEVMPSIEDSKDWSSEQITMWFNTNVLNKTDKLGEDNTATIDQAGDVMQETQNGPESTENVGDVLSADSGSVDIQDLKKSKNKKSTKNAVIAVLTNRQDSPETRQLIIDTLKNATGSHARQVGNMPDAEIHKYINNAKIKLDKAETGEV